MFRHIFESIKEHFTQYDLRFDRDGLHLQCMDVCKVAVFELFLSKEYFDKYESRSMHGQIPVIWKAANDFNIYDIKDNKFIDFTSAIFFSNVGHSNSKVTLAMQEMLKKPIRGASLG